MIKNTRERVEYLEERIDELVGLLKAAAQYIELLEGCQDLYYRATQSEEAKKWEYALSKRLVPFDPQKPSVFDELTALNSQYDSLNTAYLKQKDALVRIAALETQYANATVRKIAKIAKSCF